MRGRTPSVRHGATPFGRGLLFCEGCVPPGGEDPLREWRPARPPSSLLGTGARAVIVPWLVQFSILNHCGAMILLSGMWRLTRSLSATAAASPWSVDSQMKQTVRCSLAMTAPP